MVPELSENATDSWRQHVIAFTPIESVLKRIFPLKLLPVFLLENLPREQ